MIGILGAGFGLYGYLPALALLTNDEILLLDRYKERFYSRNEIIKFEKRVRWIQTVEKILEYSNSIVFATQPKFQTDLILSNVSSLVNKKLILEKPISINSSASRKVLEALKEFEVKYRIGYTFLYTDWSEKLLKLKDNNQLPRVIKIEWLFLAHHYENDLNNWKRNSSEGGGILNFYGIHLIALSFLLGYTKLDYSHIQGKNTTDTSRWNCKLINSEGKIILIDVDSFSYSSRFKIDFISGIDNSAEAKSFFENETFLPKDDKCHISDLDLRINALQRVYSSLIHDNRTSIFNDDLYLGINILWSEIENNSNYRYF
ncbi:MAG: hypothetical protein IM577_03940 [Chitinophagaceae bacterium]|nr:hypothetical protein [Chitinophagaceae bacterium]